MKKAPFGRFGSQLSMRWSMPQICGKVKGAQRNFRGCEAGGDGFLQVDGKNAGWKPALPETCCEQGFEGGVVTEGGEGGLGLEPVEERGHVFDL
jgi:hypothetical protein